MNQYKVIITFNDGDKIDSKVAAWNQSDALQRIMTNEQAVEFIASHDDVKNVDITYIGRREDVPDDPKRFVLTPSEREGWIIASDCMTGMVFEFMVGVYPDSVEYLPPEGMTPLDAATAVRELGDWLKLYHADLLDDRDERSRYANRVRIGSLIATARKTQGLSVRDLAEICGVSYQNITKIENGKYNVSIDILNKICKALGLKIDFSGL